MIINIPLQIDEASFEQKVKEDYQNKVEQLLLNLVMKRLKDADDRYWNRDKDYLYGLSVIMDNRIDKFIEENRDEIVEMAVDRLEARLKNRKAIKGIDNRKEGNEK